MKKSLSILLAIALVFSMLVPAALADDAELTVEQKYEALVEAGVFAGMPDGSAALDQEMTRAQFARVMAILVTGEDPDNATNLPATPTFTDVQPGDWYYEEVEVAYAEGLFQGNGDGTFGPDDNITIQQLAIVLVNALGIDISEYEDVAVEGNYEDWPNADAYMAAALSNGLIEAATDFTANAIRAQLVASSYTAKEAVDLDNLAIADVEIVDARNLIVTFSNGDAVAVELSEEQALQANVETELTIVHEESGKELVVTIVWEVDALVVNDVSASNLAEVVVSFNQEVDSSTVVVGNFKVDGDDAADVTLLDGNTVRVLIADPSDTQPGDYKVVVENVANLAGTVMEKFETEIRVLDREIPVVEGIALTGPNTFDITFSEPIKVKPDVRVQSGIYGNSVADAVGRTVTVTLSASSLTEGEYNIRISNYEDFAGYKGDTTDLVLDYVKDATEPVPTLKSATQTQVVIEFNKPVTMSDDLENYFYHTFSAWKPSEVVASNGGKTYTLTFDEYYLPSGEVTVVVNAQTGSNAIRDNWGNTLSSNVSLVANITADTTAPVVTDIKVDSEDKISIYFSEALNQDKAEDTDNYTLRNASGDEVDKIDGASYSADASDDEYKVEITFDGVSGGNYTIDIEGLEDLALVPNAIVPVTLAFELTDQTAIDFGQVTATVVEGDKDVVYVYYPERMAVEGEYSVLRAANYLLDGSKLPNNATLEIFGAAGETVRITLPSGTVTVNDTELTIARVADAAGNVTEEFSSDAIVIGEEEAPEVESVEQTDVNKLKIVVSKPLATITTDAFKVSVTGSTYGVASIDSWEIKDNKTTIVVTVEGNAVDAADAAFDLKSDTSQTFTALEVIGDDLISEAGQVGDDDSVAIDDKRPAEVDSVAKGNDTITVSFTEAIADGGNNGWYANDLVVKKANGDTLTAGTQYTTDVVSGNIVITIAGVGDTADYTVATKDSITYILGADGVKIKTFSAKKAE